MTRLLAFLQSLGPAGAIANARVLLDQKRREERQVALVLAHLAPSGDAHPRVA